MSYSELAKIAEDEFFDVVLYSQIIAGKLRLHIVDGSYLDVWLLCKDQRKVCISLGKANDRRQRLQI